MKKNYTKKFTDFIEDGDLLLIAESFMQRSKDASDVNEDIVDAASVYPVSDNKDEDPKKNDDTDDISQEFSTSSEQPPTVVGL